jgi:hypothetical protein
MGGEGGGGAAGMKPFAYAPRAGVMGGGGAGDGGEEKQRETTTTTPSLASLRLPVREPPPSDDAETRRREREREKGWAKYLSGRAEYPGSGNGEPRGGHGGVDVDDEATAWGDDGHGGGGGGSGFGLGLGLGLAGSSRVAGPPELPPDVAWAAAAQMQSVDGLLRAQVAAMRIRLRTSVRRAEAMRITSHFPREQKQRR